MGFWPTYFGPLVAGAADKTPIVHLHAAVYVGWLAIFVTQTVLAATGRIAAHMKLGRFAIGYGVLVIAVGLLTAFARFALRVRAGEAADAQAQLLGPLLDMLVFAPFFAAAIYYRRKPELHKRLMIVATTSLLIAAVGRMQFLGEPRILLGAPDLDGADPARDGARLLAATPRSSGLRAGPRRARARGTARPRTPARTSELWLDMSGWLAAWVA